MYNFVIGMKYDKETVKCALKKAYDIYEPVFSRGRLLLVDSDNEWQTFVDEKQTHIEVMGHYFIPMLVLLIAVHVVKILLSSLFGINDEGVGVFEQLCLMLFNTVMLSLFCYTFTGVFVKLFFTIEKFERFNFGNEFSLDKSSTLMVFPYCLTMFSQILENIWSNLFFMNIITVMLSYVIVWKGLVFIVPAFLQKHPKCHIWCTLMIGSVPLVLNKACIWFLKILMF